MKVLLSCAGTGGHIYPAIAIADKIRAEDPDAHILFVGTKRGMENRIVPAAGYEIRGIDASGFNRRNLLKNVKTAADMARGSRQTGVILKEFQPDVVIGTGGYVTGVVVHKAAGMGYPCYIHEQNLVPGLANRMLERYVKNVFISFEESRAHFRSPEKLLLSGNPVRREFLEADVTGARERLGLSQGERMILVTGGSLGAKVLNLATLDLISELSRKGAGIKVFFVSGRRYYEEISESLAGIAGADAFVRLIDYTDEMPLLMSAADLIVSRAGAVALSEISASCKASVLIPSPNVTNNHQYHNAKAFADAGAAVMVQESSLKEGFAPFTEAVLSLLADDAKMADMARRAAEAGKIDAVDFIYKTITM